MRFGGGRYINVVQLQERRWSVTKFHLEVSLKFKDFSNFGDTQKSCCKSLKKSWPVSYNSLMTEKSSRKMDWTF